MSPKVALLASLGAATVLTAGGYLYTTYIAPPPAPAAVATTASPTRARTPELVATPGAPPVVDRTCSDSADWDRAGGTTLIDAYINNQDSGNINAATLQKDCPQFLPKWQQAQGGIPSGVTSAVPADVKPGTYETTSADLDSCYWERSKNGKIVDNRLITASTVKQRVTIKATDDTFVSRGCGSWVKAA